MTCRHRTRESWTRTLTARPCLRSGRVLHLHTSRKYILVTARRHRSTPGVPPGAHPQPSSFAEPVHHVFRINAQLSCQQLNLIGDAGTFSGHNALAQHARPFLSSASW